MIKQKAPGAVHLRQSNALHLKSRHGIIPFRLFFPLESFCLDYFLKSRPSVESDIAFLYSI